MNHIAALAIAHSIQRDRLEEAERRRPAGPVRAIRRPRVSHFGEMARVLLVGFRHKPQPTR